MASESSTAVEVPAASPRKLDNVLDSNGVSNGDLISAADSQPKANGFVENVDKLPPIDPSLIKTLGEESGWGSVSNDGNNSGWITADRPPVDLPPSIVPPATEVQAVAKLQRFYMVRIPRSVDEKIKNDIRLAELKLEQTVKKRDQYRTAMQNKREERATLIEKVKHIREKERKLRELLQGKKVEMEPVQAALNKFRNPRIKGGICSSEEELNERIAELEYRIQHESIPLKEEKQLLREIKQLEATRSQVCANVELSEKIGSKDEIQDQFKDLRQDVDSLKKEYTLARSEIDGIEREIQKLGEAVVELKAQHEAANAAQQDAFNAVRELKKKENAKNDIFYQNKRDVQNAREMVARKDLEGVRSFCSENVEKFMSLWNGDDKFRSEYVKSNEKSTVRRLETLDGRALGPGERAPVIKDDVIVPAIVDDEPPSKPKTSKTVAEVPKVVEAKEISKEKKAVKEKKEVEEDVFIPIMTQKPKPVEVTDSDEIKEKIRQEQIAKAKEAEERKKKRAERADMKAQARAKKEAERKEKEKERKAQKKSGALVTGATSSVVETTPAEEETEAAVVEEPEEKVEEISRKASSANSTNNKSQKGAIVNRRKANTREVRPPRPKLPSKKSSPLPLPLWVMLSAAGVLVLLVILALFLWQ